MRVEVLYFDGCPSYQRLLPRLREVVAELDLDAEIDLRRVESLEDADRERFLGSPTVRVDGEDVDVDAGSLSDFGIKCRLYRTSEGLKPLPPDAWIREALMQAVE